MASTNQCDHNYTNLTQKAKDLINLLLPITVCLCVVVCSISGLEFYNAQQQQINKGELFLNNTTDPGLQLKQTIYNVLLYIGMLAVLALIGVGCCKLRWYKFMFCSLMLLTTITLIFVVVLYISAICMTWNLPLDYVTMVFVVWNLVATGILAMFWLAPIFLRHAYLVTLAAHLALLIVKFLPYWTNWALLVAIAIWDIIAVLWKQGPVNLLLKEILDFKGELNVPVLIYSTNGMEVLSDCVDDRHVECMNDSTGITLEALEVAITTTENDSIPWDGLYPDNADFCSDSDYFATNDTSLQIFSELKLGLADFIFYSVLIAQTQLSCNWSTTVACFLAIIIGLSFTFFLLFKFQKDLPALPLSIGLGVLFTVSTYTLLTPLMDILAVKQIFI